MRIKSFTRIAAAVAAMSLFAVPGFAARGTADFTHQERVLDHQALDLAGLEGVDEGLARVEPHEGQRLLGRCRRFADGGRGLCTLPVGRWAATPDHHEQARRQHSSATHESPLGTTQTDRKRHRRCNFRPGQAAVGFDGGPDSAQVEYNQRPVTSAGNQSHPTASAAKGP